MTKARQNGNWMGRVRNLLSEGYGVEDIAVMLSCDVEDVRREVEIRRAEGELSGIYADARAKQKARFERRRT